MFFCVFKRVIRVIRTTLAAAAFFSAQTLRSFAYSALSLMAALVFSVQAHAFGVRLEDPYVNFRKALTTETWAVEDYQRARNFNIATIATLNAMSANTTDFISDVDTWNKAFKFAIDVVDFGNKIKDVSTGQVINLQHQNVLKSAINKISTTNPVLFYEYVKLIKKAYPEASREMVINSITQAAWLAKLGQNNGLGDSGVGDVYDLLWYADGSGVNSATATSFYDFLKDKTHAPWLNALIFSDISKQVELRVLDVFENLGSRTVPWAYIGIESAKIINDFGSAAALGLNTTLSEQRWLALEFLKYYLLGFAGDRVAFERALGKPDTVTWTLKDAFVNFAAASDSYNNNIRESILPSSYISTVSQSELNGAYLVLLGYFENNQILSFKITISPQKIANRNLNAITTAAMQLSENVSYKVELDPYMAQQGCTITSAQTPVGKGLTFTTVGQLLNSSITHQIQVAAVGDVSFTQDIAVDCGLLRKSTQTHYFANTIIVPVDYFNLSAPPTVSATSSFLNRLTLTFNTPRIESLFIGMQAEILNAKHKNINYWVEEEVAPGQWENLGKFEFFDPMAPFYQTLTATVATVRKDDNFFISRVGGRIFRLGITVYNTDFPIEGSGNTLTWVSPPLTVNAADVVWDWAYNPVRITVDDVATSEWDSYQRSMLLTAGQAINICVGATNAQDWGSAYSVKLVTQTMTSPVVGQTLTAQNWDAATGCASFTPTTSGVYQLQALFADYLDNFNTRATAFITRFPHDYVQVLGQTVVTNVIPPVTPSPVVSKPLNDSGITTFSNDLQNFPNNAQNNLAIEPATHPRQDARYGRDAQAASGKLIKIGGGDAGFDFTKIANDGSVLPTSAVLGSGPQDWACTRDNVTGLIWEVKTTSGLRSLNHAYSWFNSDSLSNSGIVGTPSDYDFCFAKGRCDTEKFVQDVNAIGLCGASDWRMPHVKELETIADFGRFNPAIDPTYFPNTGSSSYWSGLPERQGYVWLVDFSNGRVGYSSHFGLLRVRLVRTGQ
ncbi:MAG: hypothetical protein COW02_05970 [Comamonadaceae bacterium CG12_big_fil_rev_8_21_14_0_65_59_15]|nr:MAG: hypothetical protein COW02_05970 [Comamonadaceae bacterium CG12_big_fil_rev_8_21_14_0_65_59_15]